MLKASPNLHKHASHPRERFAACPELGEVENLNGDLGGEEGAEQAENLVGAFRGGPVHVWLAVDIGDGRRVYVDLQSNDVAALTNPSLLRISPSRLAE